MARSQRRLSANELVPILQLLATYGLRSGEIRSLTIEDIDWRAESLRVLHAKTGACSFLFLMAPVGEGHVSERHGAIDRQTRQEWLREAGAHWHPSTLLHRARIVDRFLDHLVELELIANNPIAEMLLEGLDDLTRAVDNVAILVEAMPEGDAREKAQAEIEVIHGQLVLARTLSEQVRERE